MKAARGRQTAIARALGLSPAAVCKAVAKGMPTDSIEAAKSWRDSRPRRRLSAREKARIGTGALPSPINRPPEPESPPVPPAESMNPMTPASAEEQADFDEIAIKQAEIVQLSAFRFYENALNSGNAGMISGAIKNYGEAGKVAATLRERYLATREKSRQLVDLDEVLSGLGIEVAEWKRLFQTLAVRLAGQIPPEYLAKVSAEVERVQYDLMPRAETVARQLFAEPENAAAPSDGDKAL